MASLRDIRRKIKSVKSIQQITKAMKMVAAARLRRAQGRILSARPFAAGMEGLMTDLLSRLEQADQHPLIRRREDGSGRSYWLHRIRGFAAVSIRIWSGKRFGIFTRTKRRMCAFLSWAAKAATSSRAPGWRSARNTPIFLTT